MTPYETYVFYLAIKSHFTNESYNFFTYKGKVRANPTSFERRPEYYTFAKLGKLKYGKELIFANLLQDPEKWIGDIASSGLDVYTKWKARQESLSYVFESDLKKLECIAFNDLIKKKLLIQTYYEGRICLESVVILLDLTAALKYTDRLLQNDALWQQDRLRFLKYPPFLKYDRKKFRTLTLKYWPLNNESNNDTHNTNNTFNTENICHSHSRI